MRALIPILIVVAIFALPLFMVAVIDHRVGPPKGGRERFVLKSYDPRCWVGVHGDTRISLNEHDCRVWDVRCDSCDYGWLEDETVHPHRRLMRQAFPCKRDVCACQSEDAERPDWGTPE